MVFDGLMKKEHRPAALIDNPVFRLGNSVAISRRATAGGRHR